MFFGLLSKLGEKYLNFIVEENDFTDTSNTSTTDIGHVNNGHVIEDNINVVENGDLKEVAYIPPVENGNSTKN